MATTLMPLDPAASPQRVSRILTISASLLPEEVVAARRARRTRAGVIVVVLLVAVLLGSWFAEVRSDTLAADEELTAASTQVTNLQREQRQYTDVVTVKRDTQLLSDQLKAVMARDLDWAALLDRLRDTGTAAGLQVTGIEGSLTAAGAAAVNATLPSANPATAIGSLTVIGTGPDKRAVASYVDTLGKQSVLANPYVTSVTTNEDEVTWTLRVDITQAALCGRFGDKCETGGN
jgi:hypothetical protein